MNFPVQNHDGVSRSGRIGCNSDIANSHDPITRTVDNENTVRGTSRRGKQVRSKNRDILCRNNLARSQDFDPANPVAVRVCRQMNTGVGIVAGTDDGPDDHVAQGENVDCPGYIQIRVDQGVGSTTNDCDVAGSKDGRTVGVERRTGNRQSPTEARRRTQSRRVPDRQRTSNNGVFQEDIAAIHGGATAGDRTSEQQVSTT